MGRESEIIIWALSTFQEISEDLINNNSSNYNHNSDDACFTFT